MVFAYTDGMTYLFRSVIGSGRSARKTLETCTGNLQLLRHYFETYQFFKNIVFYILILCRETESIYMSSNLKKIEVEAVVEICILGSLSSWKCFLQNACLYAELERNYSIDFRQIRYKHLNWARIDTREWSLKTNHLFGQKIRFKICIKKTAPTILITRFWSGISLRVTYNRISLK